MQARIEKAAEKIINSRHCVVFTGAGISVESGIPPFRGEGGLWNKYDPEVLELSFFKKTTPHFFILKIYLSLCVESGSNTAMTLMAAKVLSLMLTMIRSLSRMFAANSFLTPDS